jgi:hypothetical protein
MIFTVRIVETGNLQKERVVLKARTDGDAGDYAIFHCFVSEDDGRALSGDVPNAYWFPALKVKAGDLVVLYTKSGSRSKKVQPEGGTTHFFYWEKSESIWNSQEYKLALVNTDAWTFYPKEP